MITSNFESDIDKDAERERNLLIEVEQLKIGQILQKIEHRKKLILVSVSVEDVVLLKKEIIILEGVLNKAREEKRNK